MRRTILLLTIFGFLAGIGLAGPAARPSGPPQGKPLPPGGGGTAPGSKEDAPVGIANIPEKKNSELPEIPEGTILMNFSNADLQEVLKFFSEVTGETFMETGAVQGQVTIINPQPLPVEDAFRVLEAILEINGLTLVTGPNMYKIVPITDARTRPIPTKTEVDLEQMVDEDRVVTQMIPLRYADANEIRGVITGLLSQAHHIMVSPKMNMLIITEVESNLKRIVKIVQAFDVDVSIEEIEIFYLDIAPVQEVVSILNGLFGGGGKVTSLNQQTQAGPPRPPSIVRGPRLPTSQPVPMGETTTTSQFKILAVPRNNAILVLAPPDQIKEVGDMIDRLDVEGFFGLKTKLLPLEFTDAEDMAGELQEILSVGGESEGMQVAFVPIVRLNAIVAASQSEEMLRRVELLLGELDVEASGSGKQIRVFYLQNAKAEDLAATLEEVFSEGKEKKGVVPGVMKKPQGREGAKGSGMPTPPAASLAEAVGAPRGEIRIVSDEPTNALIISASAGDFQYITELIEQLDIMPLQVLVKVIIAEVSLDDDIRFGVQWFLSEYDVENSLTNRKLINATTDGTFLDVMGRDASSGSSGSTSTSLDGDDTDGSDDGGGSSLDLPPGLRELSGALSLIPSSGSQGAFAYLDTVDMVGAYMVLNALAQDSRLNILSTPQILTANNKEAEILIGQEVPIVTSSQVNVSGESSYEYFQYEEVGIKLTVTPRINQERFVALDVEQEIKDVSETVVSDKYPILISRKATTSVFVKDQETIVIGGLISETTSDSIAKVPLLGDIPILGWLFKEKVKANARTELMIFITPYVMESPEDVEKVTRHAKADASQTDKKFDIDELKLESTRKKPSKGKIGWWRRIGKL